MMRLGLALLCLLAWMPAARAEARVLALTPATCEMLYAIGAGSDLVGASGHCDYPPAARHLPRIADYQRLYVEPALRLRPTLAVTGAADLAGLAALRSAGVRVLLVHPKTVQDVIAAMQALGKATGHVQGATRAVAAMRRRLARLAAAAPGPAITVFYEDWSRPLMTEGGPSFITDALARIGARNVFGRMAMETLRTSVEAVVRARPQAIVVPGATPARLAKRRAFWQRWLPGVPVLTVDADLMQRPGPRLVDGMAELQQHLLRVVSGGSHAQR